ncbi:MAG TPA: hypothetical protein VF821_14270 [Lentzea sp.]
MLLRTAAIVTASAALAGSLLAGGGVASAAPVCDTGPSAADIATTVDPHSNLRVSPGLRSTINCTTDRLTGINVICWVHGAFYDDGHTSTDVWYYGTIGPRTPYSYVWGGNVNTQHDPPPGLREC